MADLFVWYFMIRHHTSFINTRLPLDWWRGVQRQRASVEVTPGLTRRMHRLLRHRVAGDRARDHRAAVLTAGVLRRAAQRLNRWWRPSGADTLGGRATVAGDETDGWSVAHASRTAPEAVGSVGAVAAAQERGKVTKYLALAEALGFVFKPFGVETWGAWGPGATQVLHQLVAHAETARGTWLACGLAALWLAGWLAGWRLS
eukprot:SAG22_NODE_10_length_35702_cov_72.266992_3_plen_202_part_00